ncbi:hypothetical protein M5K25_015505 [Dendrobium thyrsiflorum]|uniref:Uncharacterized protein n=1 Tax=Dendrobium thyrsiflorum TaxID=117978 RepID=A0ABD0URA3_DENTH
MIDYRTILAGGFLSKSYPTVHQTRSRSRYKFPSLLSPSLQFLAVQILDEMEVDRREQGWETPKRGECRIPAELPCPPPPRKRPPATAKRQEPPIGGYFQPPDLEVLFALAPRREVCV